MILRGKEKEGTEWGLLGKPAPLEAWSRWGLEQIKARSLWSRQSACGIPAQELMQADMADKFKAG